MTKRNGTKKRSTNQSLRFDFVKRIKSDPESRARERLRESFSDRLRRIMTEKNLSKIKAVTNV